MVRKHGLWSLEYAKAEKEKNTLLFLVSLMARSFGLYKMRDAIVGGQQVTASPGTPVRGAERPSQRGL